MKNREIKFRVWNGKTKSWVHAPEEEVNLFGECILLGGFMCGIGILELNDCIPLQYTGIKDKNKKEIYEGDLLFLTNNLVGLVAFEDGQYIVKNHIEDESGCVLTNGKECNPDKWYEIAGNIFENPDLIKSN